MTLYWIPGSSEELDRSQLMSSQTLMDAATRCVGLEVILPAQTAVIERLGLAGRLPAALIVDRQGDVLRTVESVRGELAVKNVEAMISAELRARDEQMYERMTAASQKVKEGNNSAAIQLYEKVWDDRCLFLAAAAEAQRALKSLGVVVQDPAAPPPPSNLPASPRTDKPVRPGGRRRGRDRNP